MLPKALSSLAAVVLVVAACGGSAAPTTRPTASPAATAVATPAAASTPTPPYTVVAGPKGTTLLHAPSFDVPLSLTFGPDWTLSAVGKGLVDLMWGGVDMGIHSTALVTLPGATSADPYIPFPADFVAWLDNRSEFVPAAPRTVTLAGRTGTLVDADFVWKDGTAKSEFLRYGSGGWLYDQYDEGNRARFIVLPGPKDVGGIVVVMNARIADFEGAATALDALLATVKFDAPS
jgi:hypothetical protein